MANTSLLDRGEQAEGQVRLGQAGYIAKGVAFALIGALVLCAAWTHDAQKAGGLDVALQ